MLIKLFYANLCSNYAKLYNYIKLYQNLLSYITLLNYTLIYTKLCINILNQNKLYYITLHYAINTN